MRYYSARRHILIESHENNLSICERKLRTKMYFNQQFAPAFLFGSNRGICFANFATCDCENS